MKAKINNGVIQMVSVPSIHKNVIGFDKLSSIEQQEYGFYDIVEPPIDHELQKFGEPVFDEVLKVVTYPVIDLVFDIDEVKEQKLSELQSSMDVNVTISMLYGLVNKLIHGESISTEDKKAFKTIGDKRDQGVIALNSMTDVLKMKKIDVNNISNAKKSTSK